MDIFELAKAKKLFGGGGSGSGKREGTAIPYGQPVEKIYFNTNLTVEETNAILSQLTYVTTPLLSLPLCAIYANTADGNTGSFIVALRESDGGTYYNYRLQEITNISNEEYFQFYGGYASYIDYKRSNGWVSFSKESKPDAIWDYTGVNSMFVYHKGQTLTDFNGIPVGAENEKIKNVLSITPF